MVESNPLAAVFVGIVAVVFYLWVAWRVFLPMARGRRVGTMPLWYTRLAGYFALAVMPFVVGLYGWGFVVAIGNLLG